MGQTLSEPVTEKHTSEGADDRLYYAASGMQGWRISMEDAHTTLLHLSKDPEHPTNPSTPSVPAPGDKRLSFFAVYDGHGGPAIAQFAGQHLHGRIIREESFDKGDFKAAIKAGFLGVDADLRQDPEYLDDPSGCTAVMTMITDDYRVFCGNAGDSRAVLSCAGSAFPLSHDHKPVNPDEINRILAAGGFVEFGRVNGNLALSRAMGDFNFKRNTNLPVELQIVTVNPDIIEKQLVETDEFIILACDGIWDCMSNQEAVNFVRSALAASTSPTPNLGAIAEAMMEKCLATDSELAGVGCDNMTVILVALLRGKTKEAWLASVQARIKEAGLVPDPAKDDAKTAVPDKAPAPFVEEKDEKIGRLLTSPDGTGAGKAPGA